jgi:hypothetical protein
MSQNSLSKAQFVWTKRHDEDTGETHYVHTASGHSVFNNYNGRYRWQIQGGTNSGEIHTSLAKAKKVIEDHHDASNWNNMSEDQKAAESRAYYMKTFHT